VVIDQGWACLLGVFRLFSANTDVLAAKRLTVNAVFNGFFIEKIPLKWGLY
jgi:hypothetical protein